MNPELYIYKPLLRASSIEKVKT